MNSAQIEIAVAHMYGIQKNIIVPNISWGMNLHECDLLIVNENGFATEVEIKISKSDLVKDLLKSHGHESKRIKYLYYALPKELVPTATEILPAHAGIIQCSYKPEMSATVIPQVQAERYRRAKPNPDCIKMPITDIAKLTRLGVMRYWNMRTVVSRNS